MKICFVAPADNYHTKKWCRWFAGQGHEVHVVSFHRAVTESAKLHWIDGGVGVRENDWKKLRYLLRASELRNILADINPDIVNVHYATSYGTAAALAGLKGYVLSVWGADVYNFPKKSLLHRLMLRFSLNKASYLFSTSKAMAVEAGKYTKKVFDITPFGVDTDLFSLGKRSRTEDGLFIVGTVKTLSRKYGIDYLSGFVRKASGRILLKSRRYSNTVCEKQPPESSKRILIVTENYPDIAGGVSMMYVHTRNLYYQEQGLDVTVVSFQARTGYIYEGIPVMCLKEYEACSEEYSTLVLHAANIKHHYRFLKKYGARFSRFVFFYHGHEALNVTQTYPRPYPYMKRSAFRMLAQEAYDGIKLAIWRKYLPKVSGKSHFVFVSGWMYREFLKWTRIPPDITAGRYSVIYNCVGKAFEEGSYDADGEKTYDFITVRSSLDGSKYCMDLVNQLAFHNPSLCFAVVGRGRFFDFNEKAPNLEWKNQTMTHHEMIPILQKARFALMPTRTDAQGLMMCEMAAFGIPVITSDIPVCHEVFDGVENVYFIRNEEEKRDMREFVKMGSRCVKDRRLGRESTVMREVELLKKL